MKKLITLFLTTTMIVTFAGCGTSKDSFKSETKEDSKVSESIGEEKKTTEDSSAKKIGISYAEVSAGFNVAQAEYFEKVGEEYGYDVTLINADNNIEKQVGDVEDLIAQGADVIFFNPVDSSACSTVFEIVKKSGVDMVVFNAKADGYEPGKDYLFLGIGECYDQGAEVGKWVADHWKGEDTMKILELTGSTSLSWSLDRGAGFEETIDKNVGNYKFVSTQCAECSRVTAQQITMNVLQANQGDVDVIYAHNDEMILGAIAAIKEFGLEPGKDIITCGIDLSSEMCEAIMDGELSSCLIIDPKAIVNGMYENYTKYLKGEDYETVTGLELRMCDSENVEEEYNSGDIIF
ncbi:MAG: substrate-binding domain-containing protein [Oliverpabstia sp.]